jgi:S1-C subfamily serine protease
MILNPEECGGPVLDLQGEVVGIVVARAGRIRSYVMPSETIVSMLQRKPVEASLAKVKTPEPEPQLSRNREVRPRLNRSDMDRMRARMKEMQQFMRQLDQELGGLDR